MNHADLKAIVPGPLSVRECDVLASVASGTTATRALEVGHYLGLSTSVLLRSLPAGCELVTVDHHQGDNWTSKTSSADFEANIAQYLNGRPFTFVNDDMRTALPALTCRFGFVFYDADHIAQAVADFWSLAMPLLEPACTLVFDDADWDDQSTLIGLAEAAGFRSVRDVPFERHEHDKGDPETFTLEIMRRSS